MKNLTGLILFGWLLAFMGTVASCSDMDDYLKYTEGGSKVYTGVVDSVRFLSGEERIVFSGLLTSDPKITKVKVYWNMRKDSLVLDVIKTAGVDVIQESIPLPEGRYNFEVISYDHNGIPSITVSQSGVSYGSQYRQNLYNRPIKSLEKEGENAIIEWYNGDENSPFVEIHYEDNKESMQILRVPTKEERTTLTDYKSMGVIQLQAYYLPDSAAVDTFKTVIEERIALENVTKNIVNPGNPFLRGDGGTGKWGTIQGWNYTPNILNQNSNTAGGWSTDAGGCIHLESQDWGGSGFENGKISQTITLPAGRYSLEYYSDGFGGDATSLFAVALGHSLPDIESAESAALAYEISENGNVTGNHSIYFTLDKEETVTLGWSVTIPGSNTWYHINGVKLMILGL